jgi:uncharacterized protein (TIGR01319 family)
VTRWAVCADVGSTYTKVVVVDLDGAEVVAQAAHRTTSGTDVLRGLDAAVAAATADLGADPGAGPEWYVCSSAGGGLRLAVVGYEALVTAQAGHRVGLSAGAQVVHVAAGLLDAAAVGAVRAARPDVILLVGGTDGGDGDVLRHNAARLAAARVRVPVVVAGNAAARDDAADLLAARNVPITVTGNVLPRIGVLDPGPARAAIRDVFLRHVIGGKGLSRGPRFASLVRAATPDAVLRAVEVVADVTGSGVLVVDVGGATTDVYSALVPDAESESGPRRDVAGTLWRARTVEGDLGVGVGASGVVDAAAAERLDGDGLAAVVAAGVPFDSGTDRRLAELAAVVALRRHARGHAATPGGLRTGGRDLREVRLVIGSGGVLRHGGGQRVLAAVLDDTAGGWPAPVAARQVIDSAGVLAAVGLLAGDHPQVAASLVECHLVVR